MQNKNHFIGFPFYVFITLLLGVIATFSLRDLLAEGAISYAILCAILFAAHIALYWLNMKQFQSERWWMFYYAAQTLLILALVSIPYGTQIRLTILGSAVISIIGEALGLWGNTRRALILGLYFFAITLVVMLRTVAPGDLGVALTTVLVNGGFIVLFMVVLNQQLAERQKAMDLAESLESANAKLAASAAKIETLTLQNERQRMARELHDTLAQGVAGLILQLEAVKAHLAAERTERALTIVEQAIVRARGTLAESRAAIDDLRAAPANLSDAVREKVERFTQATGIPCDMDISVKGYKLPLEVTTHALSILGEALANVARHAQATKAYIRFVVQERTLELEVRDDGKGFDANQEGSGRYGLLGMRERARMTGGQLTIDSNPNDGTRVHFLVGRES